MDLVVERWGYILRFPLDNVHVFGLGTGWEGYCMLGKPFNRSKRDLVRLLEG